MAEFDAVVIGASPDGLACAAVLARAGLTVVVVERLPTPGGVYATEELVPGYRFSAVWPEIPFLSPQVKASVGVDVELVAPDPFDCALSGQGESLPLWCDGARTRETIERFGKSEADAYQDFDALTRAAARSLRSFLAYPATRKQVRRGFRKADVEKLFDRAVEGSVADLCEGLGSDVLPAAIAARAVGFSAAGPRTPGTAYGWVHNSLGRLLEVDGAWGFARGGTGSLVDAFAKAARGAGAEIRTGTTVTAVALGHGRRVSGVVLESGEEITTAAVCWSGGPAAAVDILPEDSVPPEVSSDLGLLPAASSTLIVHCALGEAPAFCDLDGVRVVVATAARSIDHLESACRAAANGGNPDDPVVRAWVPSLLDPGLAPDGRHAMTVHAQYWPGAGIDGERMADAALAALEAHSPGLSDTVEERVVLAPEDVEGRYGAPGGHPYHGEILPDWLFDRRPASPWHRYRLPVPGYLLCGPGAHPGGGMPGLPGINAARALLQDLAAEGPARAPA